MRSNVVTSARKAQGSCRQCGTEIKPGDRYFWAKPRYGGKMVKCADHPFRGSELTSSDKLSRLYAAQEAAHDAVDGWERDDRATDTSDLVSALEAAASEAQEVAEEYRESAQNIEDGFGHSTYVSEELAEKGDAVEAWADELESVDFGSDWTEEEARERIEENGGADDEEEDAIEEDRREWMEEQAQLARDAIDGLEL